jgi:hypothetical protein
MSRKRRVQNYRANKTGWTQPTTGMTTGVQADGYTGWSSGIPGGLAVRRVAALCVLLSFTPTHIVELFTGVSSVLSLCDVYFKM